MAQDQGRQNSSKTNVKFNKIDVFDVLKTPKTTKKRQESKANLNITLGLNLGRFWLPKIDAKDKFSGVAQTLQK